MAADEHFDSVAYSNCQSECILHSGEAPGTVRMTIGYTLYIFDRNVRMAMVLGLVGAGGIGRTLHDALRVFRYDQASAIITLVLVTIIGIDILSNWLRRKAQ